MLPHFLCIGAQKAGTTWLYQRLAEHPEIWLPPVKELHYFDHLFVPANRSWTRPHIQRGAERALQWHAAKENKINFPYVGYLANLATSDLFTEQWYRNAFSLPAAEGKIRGDITPSYCMIPENGINYIVNILCSVKIIYIIRDPVDRFLSQIRMKFERRKVSAPSIEDWRRLLEEPDAFNRGDYASYVPRWQRVLPKTDILFASYRQLASDPAGFLGEVENFLGVQPMDRKLHVVRATVNASKPVAVPAAIREEVERRLSHQNAFLAAEFGRDFVG